MTSLDKKAILAIAVLLNLTAPLFADRLGLDFAAKAYLSDLKETSVTEVDFDDATNLEFVLALEHPVPMIPNLRLAYADFSFEQEVKQLDQSHLDLTLYYQLVDTFVDVDLGLGARVFDVTYKDSLEYQNDKIGALLYGKVQVPLPFSGISLGATVQWGSNSDDGILDAEAFFEYEMKFGLALGGGYRVVRQGFELEAASQSPRDIETDFEGPYLGLSLQI
jgi:outer membrane protein